MEDIFIQSHHRRTTFQRCKFKHWIHYTLRRRKSKSDINYIFGSAIHEALRIYYKYNRDIKFEEINKYFELNMIVHTEDKILSNQLDIWTTIGSKLLEVYYKLTKDKELFTTIDTEKPFHLCINKDGNILCDSKNIPEDTYTVLAGKIDLIVDTPEGIYIIDHKTTGQSQEKFLEMFDTDEQLLDYSIWGRYTFGDKFKGVMVNGINKIINSGNPAIFRKWFSFTNEEIDYALSSYLDSAQEYYILRQLPHLLQQRSIQFDCNRCEDFDISVAFRKGEDFQQILDLYYEEIVLMDWEE